MPNQQIMDLEKKLGVVEATMNALIRNIEGDKHQDICSSIDKHLRTFVALLNQTQEVHNALMQDAD
jgi:hypothetical protein